MSTNVPRAVFDDNGVEYWLERELGRGGQGQVFAVRGQDLAVKLVAHGTPGARQQIRENVARVKRLELSGLCIAKPLRTLAEPHVGYVMELMTDMVPIHALIHPVLPASEWYCATGGLRRRLHILSKLAHLLRDLHGRGLAYGDLSANNVFISSSATETEVWLIDCDNIAYGVLPRTVRTDGYAAPELYDQHPGPDSLSDSWSLATLVFEVLTSVNPFDGDVVDEGPPELQQRAFRGELPWIDDADDQTNSCTRGFPRRFVLSPRLQELAQQCFGASRTDREQRPSAAEWAERLDRAADQTLVCENCTHSFYYNEPHCPWCTTLRPAFVLANIYVRDGSLPDHKGTIVGRVVVQEGHAQVLARRHLNGGYDETAQLHLELTSRHFVVRGEAECSHGMQVGTALKVLSGRTERINRAQASKWRLRPLASEELQRIVAFAPMDVVNE